MWFGTGKGGKKNPEDVKPNLGGPSRTTSGYTTQSGVIKRWLCTALELTSSSSRSDVVQPFVETPAVKSFAIALENDRTALKPSIQYDEQQQLNVGLQERVDFSFVKGKPNPTSEYLRSNVVTEANVSFISTLDNKVSMPVGVRFVPKSGKTGENMKKQFLDEISILQTCKQCLLKSKSFDHVISDKDSVRHCISKCEMCLDEEAVCPECLLAQQASHHPPLRACTQGAFHALHAGYIRREFRIVLAYWRENTLADFFGVERSSK